MPVSSRSTISTFQRRRSAKRSYMRKSSPAKSAASSPPVPARISRKTLRASFGSLGSRSTFRVRLDPFEVRREGSALARRHLVKLVARRQGFRQLARAGELAGDAAAFLDLRHDRLEVGERTLGVPDGAVVLDEVRVGEPASDFLVAPADVFEFFEHGGTFG